MQVIVKGRHTHVPAELKELATHKLEKVGRYLDADKIKTLEIEFSEEHNPRIADKKHTVEVTLITKAHTLRAHASGPDAASAVDMVLAKIEQQAKKIKEKNVKRGRGSKTARESELLGSPNGAGAGLDSDEDLDEGEPGPRITSVKRFAVKPMTAEEAVLQMQSLGHDFYLFVNAESEQAGVVYRRRDGSFGLIEPE